MEDILASIRRILSEDEAQPAVVPNPSADAAPAPAGPVPAIPQPPVAAPETARGARGTGTPDVLVLDSSMLVQETPVTPPDPTPAPTPLPRPAETPEGAPARAPAQPTGTAQATGAVQTSGAAQSTGSVQPTVPAKLPAPPPSPPPPPSSAQLVAPEAAAAAASAVGTLMRTLAAERGAAVSRGGPTIEDLVREELRPMLKAWLDIYLPPLVERLVRAEIERVVGHTTP